GNDGHRSLLGIRSGAFGGAHLFSGVLDRLDDVLIAGASAQVAFQRLADLRLGRIGVATEQVSRGHDHTRRAVAALKAVLFPEAFLNGVHLAVFGEALDSRDLTALGLHSQCRARLDRASVHQHRARAAQRSLAPNMRAGQLRDIAEVMHEQHPRVDIVTVALAVDCDSELHIYVAPWNSVCPLPGKRWPQSLPVRRSSPLDRPGERRDLKPDAARPWCHRAASKCIGCNLQFSPNTRRARTRPSSTSLNASLTCSSLRFSWITLVMPEACSSKVSASSTRVPTTEPAIEIPLSTVSKIGICTVLSAGSPTNTSFPPRRRPW